LNTATPIHHVVIVIDENRSFDNLFATYQPPAHGQSVFNLLSEGIVNTDGSPGPNFQQAAQKQAIDTPADEFMLSPRQTGSFTTLPQPSMGLNLLLLPYSLEYGILSEPGLSEQDQHLLHHGGFFGRFSPDPRLSVVFAQWWGTVTRLSQPHRGSILCAHDRVVRQAGRRRRRPSGHLYARDV
jgi:hypothetical protein